MEYNLSLLKKLSGNDEQFIVDMLVTFKKTSPPIVERMQQYMNEKKYIALGKEAHKLIPGVSFLGASQLKDELVKIEEGMKLDAIPQDLNQCVINVKKFVEELIQQFETDFNLGD